VLLGVDEGFMPICCWFHNVSLAYFYHLVVTSPLNWNKIRNIKKKESARCFILVNLTANITTNNQAGYGVIGVKQTINAAIYTLSKKKGIVEALAMGSKICSASQHSNLPLLR